MSTPQQSAKAPRRSAKKPKQNAPNGPHSRGTVSENELSQPQTLNQGPQGNGDIPGSRRKQQASNKKVNGSHQRGSVSENAQPEKTRATPIKQAYAGPTFHQSPAASALPMPSFYSKSVPSTGAIQPTPAPIPEQQEEKQDGDVYTPAKRESTPLEFLFQAARQARGTPRGESPGVPSPHIPGRNGSPASRSPAPKDPDSMFPFELDGGSTPGEDGTSFATPYKARIEAVRGPRPVSEGAQSLDENERRAKTDALKKLLMKTASEQQSHQPSYDNPFNARAPQNPNQLAPPPNQIRQRSGPSTPSYMQSYNGNGRGDQYFPQMSAFPPNDFNQYPMYRGTSNLRNVYGAAREPEPAELSSDSTMSPPRASSARKPSYPISPPGGFSDRLPTVPNMGQTATHKTTPSVQQMEDDLRRVLKLDLTSRG